MRTGTVYIDGTHLNDDILIHTPRLQRISLHIDTWNFRKRDTQPIPEMIGVTNWCVTTIIIFSDEADVTYTLSHRHWMIFAESPIVFSLVHFRWSSMQAYRICIPPLSMSVFWLLSVSSTTLHKGTGDSIKYRPIRAGITDCRVQRSPKPRSTLFNNGISPIGSQRRHRAPATFDRPSCNVWTLGHCHWKLDSWWDSPKLFKDWICREFYKILSTHPNSSSVRRWYVLRHFAAIQIMSRHAPVQCAAGSARTRKKELWWKLRQSTRSSGTNQWWERAATSKRDSNRHRNRWS